MVKVKNDYIKVFVGAFIFYVVASIVGGLLYGNYFVDIARQAEHITRHELGFEWSLMLPGVLLLQGFILTLFYSKVSKIKTKPLNKMSSGISFGFTLFFLVVVPHELLNYVMFPYPFDVALLGMGCGFATLVIWGILVQKLFKN
jgi:hypothetical protein